MQIYGLPEAFWVVTRPTKHSELGDIWFRCTFEQLMRQTRGGLQEKEIVGIYADESQAKAAAERLLGINIVDQEMHSQQTGSEGVV